MKGKRRSTSDGDCENRLTYITAPSTVAGLTLTADAISGVAVTRDQTEATGLPTVPSIPALLTF